MSSPGVQQPRGQQPPAPQPQQLYTGAHEAVAQTLGLNDNSYNGNSYNACLTAGELRNKIWHCRYEQAGALGSAVKYMMLYLLCGVGLFVLQRFVA